MFNPRILSADFRVYFNIIYLQVHGNFVNKRYIYQQTRERIVYNVYNNQY